MYYIDCFCFNFNVFYICIEPGDHILSNYKICVPQWFLAIDSKCNCRSFSVYKYENPSSATFNNCAWIIFSQNTSNLAGYLFVKAFFNSCFEEIIRRHTFFFVRNCVRWGYYLLFWMNFVADLLWLILPTVRRSSVGSFVERDFFIRILFQVYFDFA